MLVPKLPLLALLAATTARALPSALLNLRVSTALEARQSQTCADTCGTICYWASDVSAAVAKGYSLQQAGTTLGTDKYPHVYRDDEGFDFGSVAAPYYEFPILSSFKVYSGGSPGADRVVFNGGGELAGVITHTGSSNDGFTQCTAASSSSDE